MTRQDGKVVVAAKQAFHKKCQTCHQSRRGKKPDSPAPVACKDCHQDRVFETPVEGLTLNRALPLSCTHCHELMLRSGAGGKGPIGNCEGCHRK